MINYTGWEIPEGKVVKVEDAAGRVLWALPSDGKVILQVEKITSDTYAGETTYTGEQFILLDIYPKTNGTVKVTYGGLTKTITDTSGAEEPNAQQVYFGTFNGVADEVETPASGELTIEGDCVAFACGGCATSSKNNRISNCITAVKNFGLVDRIPAEAFSNGIQACTKLTEIEIPNSVKTIGNLAFASTGLIRVNIGDGVISIGGSAFALSKNLQSVHIGKGVAIVGENPWYSTSINNCISVASDNANYKIDGNCLIEIATNTIVSGFSNSTIPTYVTAIGALAFYYHTTLPSVELLEGLTTIGNSAFVGCTSLTSAQIPTTCVYVGGSAFRGCTALTNVRVRPGVTYGEGTYEGCTGLTSIELQDGLTSIPAKMFYGCSSLTSAIIPASVAEIGTNAFGGDMGDGFTIYVLATTPPTCTSSICAMGVPIIVPKGCGEAYKAATGWKNLKDYITEAS